MKKSMIALLMVAGLAVPALAEDSPKPAGTPAAAPIVAPAPGSLTVGDAAPALTIAKWVKGSEVNAFQKGKIYVVEFWATWCGPCKKSMPHLSQLQKEYADKGVTIIGVTSQDPRNSLADVETMTKEKGDTMGYTVAWDNARATSTAYMEAAAQNGIPTAFIVDKTGHIAWIGSPFEMDEPLAKIVDGSFDVAAAKKKFQAEQQSEVARANFIQAVRSKSTAAMLSSGTTLVDSAAGDGELLNTVAWLLVDPKRGVDFKANPKLLALAEKAANGAVEATGGKDPGVLDTLARVLFVKGDTAAAIATQTKAVSLADSDEMKKDLESSLKEYQSAK
ncbi:MAG: redoxin domain-containing protein [Phycisphaerales bacterium]|nr:redoxin domain-containing protein [Planctomycetota bacterium]